MNSEVRLQLHRTDNWILKMIEIKTFKKYGLMFIYMDIQEVNIFFLKYGCISSGLYSCIIGWEPLMRIRSVDGES